MTSFGVLDPARHAGSTLLATQSDRRLVELARVGNARAFEVIVQRYRRPLLRHCSRILPLARAEDAVQQTFIKAHDAILETADDLNLRAWLYRIARNTSLNLLRESGWSHEALDERIDGVERPPEAFERRERLRGLVAAIQRLPRRQRDAIVLRELEGRSYDEIATALTVSDGAVRMLLSRARANLRSGLSAVTPPWLLARLAGASDDASIVGRAAGAAAGAGGITGVAKLSAGVLVGGALLAGGGGAVLHVTTHHRHPQATARSAARPDAGVAQASARLAGLPFRTDARSRSALGAGAGLGHDARARDRPAAGGMAIAAPAVRAPFERDGGGSSGDGHGARGSDGAPPSPNAAPTSSPDRGGSGTPDGGGTQPHESTPGGPPEGRSGHGSGTSPDGSGAAPGTTSGGKGATRVDDTAPSVDDIPHN